LSEQGEQNMSKQIQEAYIVAATRLPVGRRKGLLGHVRPDDMLAHAIRSVMAQAPGLDPALVEDVIVGCAMPEAEQGMNVARIGLLLAGMPDTSPASPSIASALPGCRPWPWQPIASVSAKPT
jgi:acetyl-CoA acyltransferase